MRYPNRPAASSPTPAVRLVISPIVTIEPTSEFRTKGWTTPLRGSRYQKLPQLSTIKAAPETVDSMQCPPLLSRPGPILHVVGRMGAEFFDLEAGREKRPFASLPRFTIAAEWP